MRDNLLLSGCKNIDNVIIVLILLHCISEVELPFGPCLFI